MMEEDLYERVESRPVGLGMTSQVFKVRDKATGEIVALKQIDKEFFSRSLYENEVASMQSRHPNLLFCKKTFETETHYVIITDLAEKGNLEKFIGGKPIPEALALSLFGQILEGLNSFHEGSETPGSRKGIHRDLKNNNIYLFEGGKVRIGDFGNAVLEGGAIPGIIGTTFYVSPEVDWRFIKRYKETGFAS